MLLIQNSEFRIQNSKFIIHNYDYFYSLGAINKHLVNSLTRQLVNFPTSQATC